LKKAILFFSFFFCLLSSQAQKTDEDYVGGGNTPPLPAGKSDKDRWRVRDNIFYGGGFGLGFSNGWIFNLNPQVGVQYKKAIGAGVGFDYQYYGTPAANFRSLGPSVFARAKAFNAILFQAEYVKLYIKESYLGENFSYELPMFLVGGGYQQGGDNGGFFLMVLWDLIQDPYNPFPSPMVRAGVSIGF
jgi:hypothetical protein